MITRTISLQFTYHHPTHTTDNKCTFLTLHLKTQCCKRENKSCKTDGTMTTTVFENNYLVEAEATNETKKKANHWKKCTVQGHPKHIVPSFSQLHFCKCSFSHSCITTNPQRSSALFQLARWASQFAWNREKNCTHTPTSTARSSSPLLSSPHPQASTKTQNLRNVFSKSSYKRKSEKVVQVQQSVMTTIAQNRFLLATRRKYPRYSRQ